MPRLDLILLPLLGGYIFLSTFNLTKYYHIRIEKQRLIYNSLVSAFLLSVLVYSLDYFLLKSSLQVNLYNYKSEPISYYRDYVSTLVSHILNNNTTNGLKHSILIFLIAYPLASFLNIFFSREFSFDYTIQRWGSQLDRLIWFSLTEKSDEDKLLMITTKSNKVYIGYINKLSEPIGESYITILPNFSGYRNKDNLKIEITTKYTDVIRKYVEEDRANEIDNKLGIILPVSEILIVSKFDNNIFGRFNEESSASDQSNKGIIKNLFNALIKKLNKA